MFQCALILYITSVSAPLPEISAEDLALLLRESSASVESYECNVEVIQRRKLPEMTQLSTTLIRRETRLRKDAKRIFFDGQLVFNRDIGSKYKPDSVDNPNMLTDPDYWQQESRWSSLSPVRSGYSSSGTDTRSLERNFRDDPTNPWIAALDKSDSKWNHKQLYYNSGSGLWLVDQLLWNDKKSLPKKASMGGIARSSGSEVTKDGIPCYTLELEAPEGIYKIWMDPAKGFRPIHVTGEMRAASPSEYTFVTGEWRFEISDIDIELIDDVWVPTRGKYRREFDSGEVWEEYVTLSDVTINHTYTADDFTLDFPADAVIVDVSAPIEVLLREDEDGTFKTHDEHMRRMAAGLIDAMAKDVESADFTKEELANGPTEAPLSQSSPLRLRNGIRLLAIALGAAPLLWLILRRRSRGSGRE